VEHMSWGKKECLRQNFFCVHKKSKNRSKY